MILSTYKKLLEKWGGEKYTILNFSLTNTLMNLNF
jgi:hypothetical protein